jgi:TonB-linked SusC/RagA family outer membrane protein
MRRLLLAIGLVLFIGGIAMAQKTVTGTVIDEDGESLIGVSVLVEGTTTGTVTDLDGNYNITMPEGTNVLQFSYTGFGTQSIVVGNQAVINVTMETSAEVLEQVIVTAFGTTTKEAFSGSADVIGSKDLEVRNVTSPIAAIEGNATGVQFTSANGGPGSSPGIFIRGVGTLNGGASPLFVVDGVQFEGGLVNINQEDIESITILKDASSTALYGSRAAAGVVLITTKKGSRKGRTSVSASVNHGWVSPSVPFYDEVTPGEYYEIMWEALRNSSAANGSAEFASANIYQNLGYNPFNVPNDQIVGTDGQLNPNAEVVYQSLNWYDELQVANTRTNYNVNVASGGERHSVFFSTSYLEEGGFIQSSEYDRLTTRVNADFDANDWLTLGGSANVTVSTAAGPSSAGSGSIVNPFGFAKNIGSIYPVFVNDQQGNIVRDAGGNPVFDSGEGFPEFNIGSRPINQGRHALQELLLNDERDRDNTYGFRFYANIALPVKGLSVNLNYGRDINELLEKEYENNIIGDAQPTGRYSERRARRQVENFVQQLNYRTTIGGLHNLDIKLGHETYDRTFTSNNGLAIDQTAEGIFEFANFATPIRVGGSTTVKRIEGYFAQANYNFDNKYNVSLSGRYDGSSVFSPGSQWGAFWGVGASWRLDQEQFIQNIPWIDRLKLRSSFGLTGSDNLGFFASRALFDLTSNAGNPAIVFSEIGNNELQWETTELFDVALEFSLFNNFLDGSLEYFNRASTDLLFDQPIPLSNGANSIPANIADMVNSGLELGLTANLITRPDFRWNVRVTASTFRNEITSLPEAVVVGNQRWEEGRSRYDWYMFHSAGVDPETGDQLYFDYELDENGNSIPVLEEDGTHATVNDWQDTERAYIEETSVPDVNGSVSTNISYKGFGLNILTNFGIGGTVLDNGYSAMMHSGNYGSSLHPDIMNAWRQPGDITDVPRMENGNNVLVRRDASRFLTDASFFALRNINLSYTFGNGVTDKLGMENLRISITGENLVVAAARRGLNPQFNLAGTPSGNTFAPTRIISVGVNGNF